MKRFVQLFVSFALAGVFLYLAMRHTDWPSVKAALLDADYSYTAPAVLFLCIIQFVRILRFGELIAPFAGKVSFKFLFSLGNVGMFAVFALPLRLGEFVRPYMLKREFNASMSASMGAVAAERVVDGLVVTLGFFAVTQAAPVPKELAYAGFVAFLVFAGAAITLASVLFFGEPAARLLQRLISLVSAKLGARIADMLLSFANGLRALASPARMARYLVSTLIFWFCNGLYNWVLLKALHIDQSLMVAYILVALTVVALMLPAGPGMIGATQTAIVTGLASFGTDEAHAFAFAIVAHSITAIVTTGFGLYSLVTANIGLQKLVVDANSTT